MEVKKTEFTLLLVFSIINLINLKNIFISSDHAGYTLKEYIKKSLIKKKIKVFDLGPNSNNSVDSPLYAHRLSKKVAKSSKNVGILVCG